MHSAGLHVLHALPVLLASLAALPGVGALLLIAWGRSHREAATADAVIVPGCRVFDDGTPSAALVRRVRLASEAVLAGAAPILVISGHRGEAEAGARLALAFGVPADRIHQEPHARTTAENAAHTAALLPHARRILVVSDDIHLLRCALIFRHHHGRVHLLAARTTGIHWRYATRELGAVLLLWIRRDRS